MRGKVLISSALMTIIAAASMWVLLNVMRGAASPAHPPLLHSVYDDRLNALDREAIEDAYRTQVAHLFAVWMKDETDQPHRAVIGVRQARRAFVESMTELDRRPKAQP